MMTEFSILDELFFKSHKPKSVVGINQSLFLARICLILKAWLHATKASLDSFLSE